MPSVEIELVDVDVTSKRCFVRVRNRDNENATLGWLAEGQYVSVDGLGTQQLKLHSAKTNLAVLQLNTARIIRRYTL